MNKRNNTPILFCRWMTQLALVALVVTGCGGGGIEPVAPPPVASISLLAGSIGGPGNIDGVGQTARFSWPKGVAIDTAGNMYVADAGNWTIRKIAPTGLVTTLAGTAGGYGLSDGIGAAASFREPCAVAVDTEGNVFVADRYAHVIRRITPAGAVTTLAGTADTEGYVDGASTSARFRYPVGLAVDSTGNVYVADSGNGVIRKIAKTGMVTTLTNAPLWTSGLEGVMNGVAVDGPGNVYVASGSISLRGIRGTGATILKITPTGIVTTFAGSAEFNGSADGTGTAARFANPQGVTVDGAGNVYVADSGNANIRKITPTGVVTTLAGVAEHFGSADGAGNLARFRSPSSATVDSAGNVYVADETNANIRKISSAGVVTTYVGNARIFGSRNGVGAAASFNFPSSVATDSQGNAYVADIGNQIIRKVTPAGLVSTLAGTAEVSGSTDGAGPAASFMSPCGIAVDPTFNVFVSDSHNHTIRKITPDGVVSTFAGVAGVRGRRDGIGSVARLDTPCALAADGLGNLFLADAGDATIRKISPVGEVKTMPETAGLFGPYLTVDGLPGSIQSTMGGLTADATGNLYISDRVSHTIRKVTPAGVVSTLAGNPLRTSSTDGVGAAAGFADPSVITVDRFGNLYVAEGNTIRKVTPSGVVSTVAGKRESFGVALGGLPGSLSYVNGISTDADGVLLVASEGAILRIRMPP